MNPSGGNPAFLHAIRSLLAGAAPFSDEAGQPGLVIELFESAPWASLTFSGLRHRLEFRLEGQAARVREARLRLQERLSQSDLSIPGSFLADAALDGDEGPVRADGTMLLSLQLQALTIEE